MPDMAKPAKSIQLPRISINTSEMVLVRFAAKTIQ